MTSLKILSEHLGLSQATISRALNGYASVNAGTRARVQQAAQELNYRPNSAARRLATGKTGAYGMILATDGNLDLEPMFSDFMSGLTEALARREREVVLGATFGNEIEATYERFFRSGRVDGFVVARPLLNDPRIDILERLGAPFVVHGRTGEASRHAFYDIDNFGAFEQATQLLVQLGHRRIALLNARPDAYFAIQRREGFLAGLAGLARDMSPISETVMSEEEGYRCMSGALERGVSAALCSSIHLALGAERAIRDRGLRLGRDVSLICHDDDVSGLSTAAFSAPLTVTRAPIRQAGKVVAGMLEDLVAGGAVSSLQQVAPVELILRASTASPPADGRRD